MKRAGCIGRLIPIQAGVLENDPPVKPEDDEEADERRIAGAGRTETGSLAQSSGPASARITGVLRRVRDDRWELPRMRVCGDRMGATASRSGLTSFRMLRGIFDDALLMRNLQPCVRAVRVDPVSAPHRYRAASRTG